MDIDWSGLFYLRRPDAEPRSGLVSLIGMICIAVLTVQHINDYMESTITTEVEVSRAATPSATCKCLIAPVSDADRQSRP